MSNELTEAAFYHKNPRQITAEQFTKLTEWLPEFGDLSGVVHDLNTNEIIGGNQRTRVFKAANPQIEIVQTFDPPTEQGTVAIGWILAFGEKYTYRQVRWTPEKAERANLICNKAGGAWDWDILNNQFDEDVLLSSGFTAEELGGSSDPVTEDGEDDVPDGGIGTPITVLGDLYEVKTDKATVRILCGDCRDMDAVNKVMNGQQAHIAVTDPPFNVALNENTEEDNPQGYKVRQIANDSMSPEEFRQFVRDAMTSAAYAMHPGALMYSFMSCKEWGTMMQVMEECGFVWSSTIIWAKSHAVLSRGDYHKRHEPIWYGKKDGAGRLCPLVDRTQNDVWDIDRPSASPQHPTTKPVILYERAILNSSNAGDNAIDFFTGSGSGAIACIKAGRNFFGIELSPTFVDRIVARIHKFSEQKGFNYTVTRNGQPFKISDIQDANVEVKN